MNRSHHSKTNNSNQKLLIKRQQVIAEAKRLGLFDFMVRLGSVTGQFHAVAIYEHDKETASYDKSPSANAN